MNATIKDMLERRSCRAYREEQIKDEELNAILEAGTYAPTGMGIQSPVIVVVQDKALRYEIARMNGDITGKPGDPFYGAPTVLIVFADTEIRTYRDDGALVMGNLLNAAHAVGVDSCFVYRAREVFRTERGKELMAKWGLSDKYEGIGNCILGYGKPEGFRELAPRKENYIIKA